MSQTQNKMRSTCGIYFVRHGRGCEEQSEIIFSFRVLCVSDLMNWCCLSAIKVIWDLMVACSGCSIYSFDFWRRKKGTMYKPARAYRAGIWLQRDTVINEIRIFCLKYTQARFLTFLMINSTFSVWLFFFVQKCVRRSQDYLKQCNEYIQMPRCESDFVFCTL